MARNTSVSLGDHFTEFIDRQIASGRFGSASEVVREGLRLLEREQNDQEWLKAQIAVAEQQVAQGRLTDDSDQLWEDIDRRALERASTTADPAMPRVAS